MCSERGLEEFDLLDVALGGQQHRLNDVVHARAVAVDAKHVDPQGRELVRELRAEASQAEDGNVHRLSPEPMLAPRLPAVDREGQAPSRASPSRIFSKAFAGSGAKRPGAPAGTGVPFTSRWARAAR